MKVKIFVQNDYNKLEQQSMVKIKYNNAKMRTKSTSTFIESRKRTLRSSNKSSGQDFVATASSSEQKVIQEIHKIFDNQQSINLSKSTDPLHQDHKLPLIPAYQNQQFVTKEKVCPITQSKNEKIDCNLEIEKRQQNNDQHSAIIFSKVLEDIQNASIDERDIFQTPVKLHKDNGKNENSNQLNQYRRSYRKLKRSNITQIPYRKFQDPFEQKIVILINRILHNKNTQKDVINFTEKIKKMSSKDIYNPYIVSGIKTVLNLIEKSSILPPNYINKLKSQFKKLSIKILTELEKTQDYSSLQVQKKETDYDLFKPKFIKKIYKFLIQTNQYEFNEAKQKSVELCQQFFSQSNNFTKEDELLSFFKEQIFLQD